MGQVKVFVDRDGCIGSGTCVQLAPGGFELDDEGVAAPIQPLGASEAALRTAERSCPVRAITISTEALVRPRREGRREQRGPTEGNW